jgi:hypothetical protein
LLAKERQGDLYLMRRQLGRAREHYDAALAILPVLGEVPYAERIELAPAKSSEH